MELFIGNLALQTSEGDVNKLFEPYGHTELKLITKNYEGPAGARRFGFITIPETAAAQKAIRDLDGHLLHGNRIRVRVQEKKSDKPDKQHAGHRRHEPHPSSQKQSQSVGASNAKNRYPWSDGEFPYRFAKRPGFENQGPIAHNHRDDGTWDVAFDIVWEILNPTAANPCVGAAVEAAFPAVPGKGAGYGGYNRRWLTVDGRLAISPFTVKSAIANAFANLMGACYRVNTSTEGHPAHPEPGQYHYSGKYKRYRVDRACSKPGIIHQIEKGPDGWQVSIQPVQEVLCKFDLKEIHTHQPIYADLEDRGRKPALVQQISNDRNTLRDGRRVIYYGPYRFGMSAELQCGDLKKPYKHRFYIETQQAPVTGSLRAENFKGPEALKEIVYMGSLRKEGPAKDQDPRKEDILWYDDLTQLKAGDWVYYEVFNGRVAAIGKNFLFKPLFLHEDAVPEDQRACSRLDRLCPRCRLFGLTVRHKSDAFDTEGYGGRFKSAALVCDQRIGGDSGGTTTCLIPYYKGAEKAQQNKTEVPLALWLDEAGNPLCRQHLLPILGPPKPNKRDVEAYYSPKSGTVKGPKAYKHGYQNLRDLAALDKRIQWHNTNLQSFNKEVNDFEYSHRLRSYAQFCREGLRFRGTVGVESASTEELAALIMVLDHRIAGHGFKIGMAKAMGLGSVRGWIERIWVRRPDDYAHWQAVDIAQDGTTPDAVYRGVDKLDAAWGKSIRQLKGCADLARRLNGYDGAEGRELCYPSPVDRENQNQRRYWEFLESGGKQHAR
jgi:hypothetical protein